MPASSIAPLISGWQRRVGSRPGPYSGAPASGESSNGLMVELLVDGSWVNITPRVMVRDNSGQISITRGQSAEGQTPNPGTCSLTLNNRDGLFSPANPLSPYYGKIGRNTQIRVSVTKGDDKSYRFWGEVTAWPESWDGTDTDVWVDIQAAGILKRLNQGSTPLRSTMYRGLTSTATTAPVAYWPCEDASSATSLASALGGQAMQIIGSPSLAADTGFLCSAPLPTMGGGQFIGTIPSYTVTGETQLRFVMYLPTAPADGTQLVRVQVTGGSVTYWAVVYNTGGGLSLRGYDSDGTTVLATSGAIAFNVDDKRVYVSMGLTQNGANVDWLLGVVGTDGSAGQVTNSFASETVGRVIAVSVSPGQTITDGVFGHVSVQSDVTSILDLANQLQAYVGEAPTSRLARLCSEEGVNHVTVGSTSTDTMGPQLPNTFLALLQECVDVDQGVLFERETAFGLAYFPRTSLYNQASHLTLSYPGNQLAAVPTPVPDDQTVRNDVTASRPNGSSARYTLETGPLSIQPPPLGVGPYPDAPTLNVSSDDDLAAHAAWRVHLGTVDEPRYPAISINLAHPSMATQRLAALNVLFGFRIVVQSPPSRLGGDISQMVIGISETITHFEHRITFVCQPESPYRVGAVEDATYGHVDSANSVLAADLTPDQTTIQVTALDGFTWTTDANAVPFDITVAGEQMTVTAVGQTLNTNPTFETDLSDWSATGATLTRSNAQANTGSWSGLITAGAGSLPRIMSGMRPVTVGAQYRVWGWLYVPVAPVGGVQLGINWYDASQAFLATSAISGTPTPGVWTLLDVTAAAPVGAGFAAAIPAFSGTPGAGTLMYVDDVHLIPVSSFTGTPQSMTVTRAVNGVAKPHQAGEPVSLTNPAIVAL